ncbi:bifunctional glycoside hydrolase 114/ polysaccharide deacetylase family protein [Cupriavidus pauculus]|uniref:bifunctional glycoside hydrolase 114/ polysaccharide deacetylase family protein n=1 Tax=Cupriavidus pauculus TaxID=82633 RepID=UPI001D0C47C6|nr:bifunctional glycoside hydrolase 114/ polysaccharide deacetylase family protein [Cupriavidus pauculus]
MLAVAAVASLGSVLLGSLTPSAEAIAQTPRTPPADAASAAPNVAFHYGARPPVDLLQAFDVAVVEPDSGFDPRQAKTPNTAWFAYVSVGEVLPSRAYFKDIPQAWLSGSNDAWNARVVDQAAEGWPAFYVDRVIAPLWQRGYRGFFLDTLDSYQLVAKTDAERARQEAGMVRVIQAIKARYPDAKLLFNRGFEILPQVHAQAYGVVFESLFRGWNQAQRAYTQVSQQDRDWLMNQARVIRDQYKLPLIAIDYCPPTDRVCQRDTARRIDALGITPYVTDPGLQTVGVGRIEVLPRRVLVVQERREGELIDDSAGVRFVSMPLNYLGYRVDFAETRDVLPEITPDRYAGVVVWANGNFLQNPGRFLEWIEKRIGQGIPVAFMNGFGAQPAGAMARMLNLKTVKGRVAGPVQIVSQDKMMGFEQPVAPDRTEALPIQVQDDAPNTRSLLRLRSGALTYDAAAIMPWGGYVSPPYTVRTNSANDQDRWVVQPLEFLREALRLPQMPVPDTTTENGRRLLTIHIDGDGFASKAEIPGGGYAGEVLLREIFDRYRLPMTMSVIEGEVGKAGMYPQLSAELEPIARKIFAQPYVEVASHTYSHPFEWQRTVAGKSDAKVVEGDEDYHLRIPGYRMDLNREIGGSIDYINRVLSPNKPVKMLLWPGDCQAPPEALKLTDAAGVLNMNGGDTMITRSNPTWTAIAPLGINKADDTFQVFATNQNENIYTNLWHGPYYGFERLVETWELTDKPYRFKAMNIYYHSYSGTKVASLKALRTVYDYALKQPVLPIHSTDYVLKVLDWQGMAVARELGDGAAGAPASGAWLVRGDGNLRNLRWTGAGVPDVASARGVTGSSAAPGGGVYVHLDGGNARFRIVSAATRAVPELPEANGLVRDWQRDGNTTRFQFSGYYKPFFRLANAGQCSVTIDGKPARGVRDNNNTLRFDTPAVNDPIHVQQQVEVRCGA